MIEFYMKCSQVKTIAKSKRVSGDNLCHNSNSKPYFMRLRNFKILFENSENDLISIMEVAASSKMDEIAES